MHNNIKDFVRTKVAKSRRWAIGLLGLALGAGLAATAGAESPLETFEWKRFEVEGRPAFVVLPAVDRVRAAMPWVFYAPTFDQSLPSARDEGWMMRRFLDQGMAIAGIDVGESYGSPAGRALYDALHEKMVKDHQGDPRAVLLARSRGGLMLYNWAADHPEKVRCIAGIYPVCNLESYPGLAKACGAYGMSEAALRAQLRQHNPVDRLAPLAQAKIPIFHIHGDVDKVVPLEANSDLVAKRYRALGGAMTLEIAPGQGHNMWPGFFQCQALVDFVIENCRKR